MSLYLQHGQSDEEKYTFTYDANGNLTAECYKNCAEVRYQYDTENRLAAVYDTQRLLMAAAYDGDGNRTFQLNYNPDAVCGYRKNVSGEIFMPAHSKNEDGSLTAEGELFSYICSATGRAYDLTEYVNDTNRQYTEVLTAYTVNSEATDSYSYAGNQRNSRNSIWTEARDVIQNETSFYLYDGRGSVTGVTWDKSRVTAVYQYDPYGQVTLGTTDHVDFYGYNGESYNPNTGLEYLRARYYNANQGRFFQEDTYLGDITDPLTLNRYAYVKNSPLNYVDPSGHTSVGVDKGNEGKFNGLKKAAMKVAGKLLDSSKDMPLRSSTGAVFGIISSHIMIAVALSEDTLCIDWEEVQLSVGSYLLGMYTESLYYSGVNLIGQDKMDMLELLQAILGTDREYKYAVENLDASAYYYGKALVDDMYAGLGEIMTSPLTMLAELLGMLGSSGGGSVSYGAIKGSASGLALEGGVVLSSGVVIAVGIVAAGGIAGSIIQFSGSARGDVNREKAEQVAEGDSNTKYEGQKYLGERKRENDFVNDKGKSTLDKHAGKRGYESPEDYLNDARNFLEKDPTSTTQSFVSKAGTYFRYDTNTNEFGIINEYGGISTYFKPEEGLTYWLEQIELYAP